MDETKVLQALKSCGGNRQRAANELGVSRSTLFAFLAKHPHIAEAVKGRPGAPPQKPRRAPMQLRFDVANTAHPWIYDRLVALALREVRAGRRVAIGQLWEVLRWEARKRPGGKRLPLNNDFRALYARKLMAAHPELKDAFRVRRQRCRNL